MIDFWLDRGVDGFRLDAVTSYYTDNPEAGIDFTRWITETAKKKNQTSRTAIREMVFTAVFAAIIAVCQSLQQVI